MRPIRFIAYVLNENTQYEISTVDKPISKKGSNSFKGYEMNAGYVLRKVSGHPNSNSRGYYPLHRLVMEEHLGRLLLKNEVVHHKDGNKTNNEIENLEVISKAYHCKITHYGKRKVKKDSKPCWFNNCGIITGRKYGLCKSHYKYQWYRMKEKFINSMYETSELLETK